MKNWGLRFWGLRKFNFSKNKFMSKYLTFILQQILITSILSVTALQNDFRLHFSKFSLIVRI